MMVTFRNLMSSVMVVAVALVMAVGIALAYEPPGLGVGKDIPAIHHQDQNGQEHSWADLKGKRGAVIFFVRSADWCPFCKIQLIDLQNRADEITERGYNVITVSYDPVEKLKAFVDQYKIDYTMLSDPESELIKAFGILNETVDKDSDWYGIPHPVIYIVNKDGVIQARFAEENYRNRPQVDAVQTAIKKLGM